MVSFTRLLARPLNGLPIAAACALLASGAACRRTPEPPPPPQPLSFWSGTTPDFTTELAASYNKAQPTMRMTVQRAQGSVVVASEVQRLGGVGIAQADVVYLLYRYGIEDHQFPHTDLRGISVLWMNNVYFIVRNDSPIRDISQLKGKRVGVMVRGTSGEFVTRIVLGAYRLGYADIQPTFETSERMAIHLKSGEIDAAISSNPTPAPGLTQANREVGLRLLPVESSVSNRLSAEYPFLKRVAIQPSKSFTARTEVETVGAEALLICHKNLSEQTVYDFTKAFFTNLPSMADKHPEAALIDPQQAPTTPIPLHPGAARFYREREILK